MKKQLRLSSKIIAIAIGLSCIAQFSMTQSYFGDNLVLEGGFENQTYLSEYPWQVKRGGDAVIAADSVITADASEGSKAVMITVSTGASFNNARIWSDTMAIDTIKFFGQYIASIDAKSNSDSARLKLQLKPRKVGSGGTLSQFSFTNFYPGANYTSFWDYFDMDSAGFLAENDNGKCQVIIDVGDVASTYYIDNYQIRPVLGIVNGGFEDPSELIGWEFDTSSGKGIDAAVALAAGNGSTNAAEITINTGTDTASHVKLTQIYKDSIKGSFIDTVKFSAKASADGNVAVLVIKYYDADGGQAGVARKNVELTTAYADYEVLYYGHRFGDTVTYVTYEFQVGLQEGTFTLDDFEVAKSDVTVAYEVPQITSTPLTVIQIDSLYEYQVTVTGSNPGAYSITQTPDNSWYSIDASGLVTGTATAADTVEITITYNDTVNAVKQTFEVISVLEIVLPGIEPVANASINAGEAYSQAMNVIGTGVNLTLETTPEASWLSLTQEAGDTSVVGTAAPYDAGTVTLTITATNGNAAQDTVISYDLTVDYTAPSIAAMEDDSVEVGAAYTNTAVITEGNLPVKSVSIEPSSILSINNSGEITGTAPSSATNMAVTVTVSDSVGPDVTESFTLKVQEPVSVNVTEIAEISIYPNPATGIVNITNAVGANITLYNITGVEVMNKKLDNEQFISVDALSSGIYMIAIQTNEGTSVQTLKVQ